MKDYVFGANILENLTTGMYQDSKIIYREYIQNACDQVDKAIKDGTLKTAQLPEVNELFRAINCNNGLLAGVRGIEPRFQVLETRVLAVILYPYNYSYLFILTDIHQKMQRL